MRKGVLSLLGIAALALAGLALTSTAVPAQQTGATSVICNKQAIVAPAGATSMLQLIAGIPNQSISVCGYIFNAGAAAAAVQLVTGTGTNCNTNQVPVTAALSIAANTTLAVVPGQAFVGGAGGAALCYNIVGTGPVSITVMYWQ